MTCGMDMRCDVHDHDFNDVDFYIDLAGRDGPEMDEVYGMKGALHVAHRLMRTTVADSRSALNRLLSRYYKIEKSFEDYRWIRNDPKWPWDGDWETRDTVRHMLKWVRDTYGPRDGKDRAGCVASLRELSELSSTYKALVESHHVMTFDELSRCVETGNGCCGVHEDAMYVGDRIKGIFSEISGHGNCQFGLRHGRSCWDLGMFLPGPHHTREEPATHSGATMSISSFWHAFLVMEMWVEDVFTNPFKKHVSELISDRVKRAGFPPVVEAGDCATVCSLILGVQ